MVMEMSGRHGGDKVGKFAEGMRGGECGENGAGWRNSKMGRSYACSGQAGLLRLTRGGFRGRLRSFGFILNGGAPWPSTRFSDLSLLSLANLEMCQPRRTGMGNWSRKWFRNWRGGKAF
jgi:hypothetical protein